MLPPALRASTMTRKGERRPASRGFSFRHAGRRIPRSSTFPRAPPCVPLRFRFSPLSSSPRPSAPKPLADRWNLAEIYPSVAAWNADAAKLEGAIQGIRRLQGPHGRRRRALQAVPRPAGRHDEAVLPDGRVFQRAGLRGHGQSGVPRARPEGETFSATISARRPRSSIPRSCTSARTALRSFSSEDPALAHLPVPARPDAASRAAYAQRRGRGAGREVRRSWTTPAGRRTRSSPTPTSRGRR